jgi:hypothetical protein
MTDRLCGLVGRARCVALLTLLIATGTCTAYADSWTIYSIDVDPGSGLPSDITLTFESGHLTLNNELIGTPGGSSFQSWTLLTAGSWAAAGTIDGQGSFVADPYAVFVPEWHGGHIQWAANTPVGYIAPLQLGVSYSGDGAAHYEGYWIREGRTRGFLMGIRLPVPWFWMSILTTPQSTRIQA